MVCIVGASNAATAPFLMPYECDTMYAWNWPGFFTRMAAALTLTFIIAGCAATCPQLTPAECALVGEYGPGGIAMAGIIVDLKPDHSFSAHMWTDVGPRFKSYTGRWLLLKDTLLLNSDPVTKHKNYTMIEQVLPGESDICIRVMNLDSTKLQFERWLSEDHEPHAMSYGNFSGGASFHDNKVTSIVLESRYGKHEFPVTSPTANCFTAFIQLPEEVPEFISDLRFLVRPDGSLVMQLPDATFGVFAIQQHWRYLVKHRNFLKEWRDYPPDPGRRPHE